MDKLARQLRDDAERIDVTVSRELDHRIDASLRAATPEKDRAVAHRAGRPPLFWWASAMTGAAAAIAVMAILNWHAPAKRSAVPPLDIVAIAPAIDLNMEAAVLTKPLQEELDNLQSDLQKAEDKVKRDIGL